MVKWKRNEPYYELQCSDLAQDAVRVLAFEGEESISRLFEYRIELLSDDPKLDPAKILNKSAAFVMNRGDDEPVKIHGIISQFEQRGRTPRYVSYYAVLVPRMWRMSLTQINEIYQKMDIKKLVTQIMKNSGFAGDDYKFDLKESYPEQEYIVQYRETNFNFINRRLEHFGIFYYFDHSQDKDVIVFSDHNDSIPAIESSEEIYYNPNRDPLSEKETINELAVQSKVVTGLVKLKDYNYRYPSRDLTVESQIDTNAPGLYYEYGDHFKNNKEGEFLARVRNEEILSRSKMFKGTADCRLFRAGFKFTLAKHYRDEWNGQEYLLTQIFAQGTQRGLFSVLPEAKEILPTFENQFEAIPLDVKFRPPRITPIPKLHGIMNSVTQTAKGEKYAYVDGQGRYRVKMPFDLSTKSSDEASQPVRMASPHSGPGYGMHFPQHGSVEVVWSCVDGDLDRPVGLGTVPNPANPSPVTSNNNSKNILNTSAGNILEMEDAEGSEQITLSTPHANTILRLGAPDDNGDGEGIFLSTDADKTINVGGDRKMTIKEDDIVSIGEDRKITVGEDQEEEIKGDRKEKVKGDAETSIKGKYSISVSGKHDLSVKKAIEIKAKGNITEQSAKNVDISAKKNVSISAKKGKMDISVKKKLSIEAKEDISAKTDANLKVGTKKNSNFLVDKHFNVVAKGKAAFSAKDKLIIKGNNQIELKCGAGSITIKKDGSIKIKGVKVELEGRTEAKIKAIQVKSIASKNLLKGAMVNVEATGINTIKGGLVKIN
jgi:type VI secretion system secreted protein VgrG